MYTAAKTLTAVYRRCSDYCRNERLCAPAQIGPADVPKLMTANPLANF